MKCHHLSTGKNRKKSNKSLFLRKSMIESHLLVGMTNAIFLSRIFFSCMLVKPNKCSRYRTWQSSIYTLIWIFNQVQWIYEAIRDKRLQITKVGI